MPLAAAEDARGGRGDGANHEKKTTKNDDGENDDDDGDYGTGGLLQDPDDYYPPSPPPTCQTHRMTSGQELTLHLVGRSPTEAHLLWNGARVMAEYLDEDPARVRGKTVLELGAGAGLPSLVAASLGAAKVVATDFPDPDLVANLQKNIDGSPDGAAGRLDALGFVWGRDPGPLLARLPDPDAGGFDRLFLADLLFRHAEHGALVRTIVETMRPRAGRAYVFFTSYRPWKQALDMAFFDRARAAGLVVDRLPDRHLDQPLFDNDPGDVEVQKTVCRFVLGWPPASPNEEP